MDLMASKKIILNPFSFAQFAIEKLAQILALILLRGTLNWLNIVRTLRLKD